MRPGYLIQSCIAPEKSPFRYDVRKDRLMLSANIYTGVEIM